MASLAAQLMRMLTAAGVPVVGVTIGDDTDKATWTVQPASLQAAAQPTIDSFDPADPVHVAADLDAAVKIALDQERLASAIVWVIIDTVAGPATPAKYAAARTKIITAYRDRPWKA
jgi:hypothetical protein